MRAWDTYTGVENVVKNMLTSLRAVSELQNPAIRERHWQQLMAATKARSSLFFNATITVLFCTKDGIDWLPILYKRWNRLAANIRLMEKKATLKKHLKAYLFIENRICKSSSSSIYYPGKFFPLAGVGQSF